MIDLPMKRRQIIFDNFIIPLYQENARIAEIHFAKTGLVIGGCCYISRRKLARKEAKRLLQDAYSEKLSMIKEVREYSEV